MLVTKRKLKLTIWFRFSHYFAMINFIFKKRFIMECTIVKYIFWNSSNTPLENYVVKRIHILKCSISTIIIFAVVLQYAKLINKCIFGSPSDHIPIIFVPLIRLVPSANLKSNESSTHGGGAATGHYELSSHEIPIAWLKLKVFRSLRDCSTNGNAYMYTYC